MQSCCTAARRALCRRSRLTVAPQASASTSAASASSSLSATSYARPIPAGSLPVYDEALAYIEQDKDEKLKAIEQLKQKLQSLGSDAPAKSRINLLDQITAAEIASLVNDPETRWKFRNGLADMSKPVNRYLAEQAWRENGDLGILMQRVSQMHIVPDILGRLEPQADLRLTINGTPVEPGSYIKPTQTVNAPKVEVQVFHPEERLYTLLMLDPDSPDASVDGFRTKCHMAMVNVPLSATSQAIDESGGHTLLSYIPPHPQNGTPYHRYTYLLFEQPGVLPDELVISEAQAEDFNARDFSNQHALRAVGVNFFRQLWDRSVSKIFADVLKQPETVYSQPASVGKKQPGGR